MEDKQWYGSLYSDLWEGALYKSVVSHIQSSIEAAETIEQLKRILGILFAILRLQTILSKGTELEELEEAISSLLALLSSGGFYLTNEKNDIVEILTNNALPADVVERIANSI